MSRSKQLLRRELVVLTGLALPAALAQLGMMLMSTADTIFLGRLSVDALDASALGTLLSWATMSLAIGMVLGCSPLIVQAIGANDEHLAYRSLVSGLVLSAIASVPAGAVWFFAAPILQLLGQDPELCHLAQEYLLWQLPSIPFFLGFNVLREYLMARGIVWRPLAVVLAANLVNVVCDAWLIFGAFGVPSLGVQGAAIATMSSRIVMFMAFVWLLRRYCPETRIPITWPAIADTALLRKMSGLGLPIALQFSFEIWAFQGVALIVGLFGKAQLGANTIVLNLCSLSFMMPLGISMAACTRVGQLMGAGRNEDAQRSSYLALGVGGLAMSTAGMFYYFARDWLPTLYTSDSEVIAITASVLPIAAAFQLFDGLQGVGGGILRGMGKSRPAAIFNAIGYYVFALPLGWWLGTSQEMGVVGTWIGLCLGLMIVAAMVCSYITLAGPRHARSLVEKKADVSAIEVVQM